jgi:ABC-type transport system substrate-binding protein
MAALTPSGCSLFAAALIATFWAGCDRKIDPANRSAAPLRLTMGFGLTTGQDAQTGIQQVARNLALEAPVTFGRDGRVQPWLLERLTVSPNRLVLNLTLKRNIKLHDGTPLDADILVTLLNQRLPAYLGAVFEDVASIEATSPYEVQIKLRRPSFIEEGLDFAVEKRGKLPIGTGAFYAVSNSGGQIEMQSFPGYHR